MRSVVDFEIHVLPFIAFDGVAAGEIGEEVGDLGRTHAVLVVIAAVLRPLPLQVAGRDGDLVAGSADDGVVADPVRVGREEICRSSSRGRRVGASSSSGPKFFFAATNGVVEFDVAVVAKIGEVIRVEEGSVVGELGAFSLRL